MILYMNKTKEVVLQLILHSNEISAYTLEKFISLQNNQDVHLGKHFIVGKL